MESQQQKPGHRYVPSDLVTPLYAGMTNNILLGTDTLITRLTDDVNQIQNGLNMGLRLLLRSPFIVLGSMVMAFTIDFKCALVFAVARSFDI